MQAVITSSTFTTLLLIIFYLIFRLRNDDKKFQALLAYAMLSFVFDFLGRVKGLVGYRFYVNSFFTLIEYSFFSYFFYQSFRQQNFRWFIVVGLIPFGLVFIYSIIYYNRVKFDFLSSSIAGFLVIIFCILFFYEQMKDPEINFIYASKTFWIIAAFLIYMSATFFLFMSMGLLTLTKAQTNVLWMLSAIANILKNILFAIAFYKPITMLIDSSFYKSSRPN